MVTGASRGIGRAIAEALAADDVTLFLAARSRDALDTARNEIIARQDRGRPESIQIACFDLADLASIEAVIADIPSLDILVHCGGMYASGNWQDVDHGTLRQLLATNVEGPAQLTRLLLPKLARNNGDVVFINSSIVKGNGAGAGQFSASQRALQALADSLRAEVNDQGVRVVSIYPGRTATPRQARIHDKGGRPYHPERLLQPGDIATAVLACLRLPATAEVTDLYLRQRFKS